MNPPSSFFVLAIISFVALLVNLPTIYLKLKTKRSWKKVKGRINGREACFSWGSGLGSSVYSYSYEFNGKSLIGKTNYKKKPREILKAGDEVSLLVNPTSPEQSSFDPPFDYYDKAFYWILVWITFLLFLVAFLPNRPS